MNEKAMLEWHSSREVVGEKMDMEEEVEMRRELEEEGGLKQCRHGV